MMALLLLAALAAGPAPRPAPLPAAPPSAAAPVDPGDGIGDLPLLSLPASAPAGGAIAVVLTGDGGWAAIDKAIAAELNAQGISVVGFDARSYFRVRREPDELGRDLARVLRHYLAAWHADGAYLVGYSRGADMLPFMVARLDDGLRARIRLVALLGLEHEMDFQWTLAGLLGGHSGATRPLRPEVERLRGLPVVCVYGSDEKDTLCPELPADLAAVERRAGGHHFDGDYRGITRAVLAHARPGAS